MSDQGCKVRTWAYGLVAVGSALGLAGCGSAGGVRGGAGVLTDAKFAIEFATTGAGDEAVSIKPEHGDAWIVSAKDGSSTIEWTATQSFGIKFVQIDDQTKEVRNKFSDKQKPGWNAATCAAPTGPCTLSLDLYPGSDKPHKKKEIRGAKYIVSSPSGCIDEKPMPADCKWQDPVIIVRY